MFWCLKYVFRGIKTHVEIFLRHVHLQYMYFEIDEYYKYIFTKQTITPVNCNKKKHDVIDFTIFPFSNNLQDLIT